jgi:hypothetical protein
MDAMEQADKVWDEIFVSLRAVSEELERKATTMRGVQPSPGS